MPANPVILCCDENWIQYTGPIFSRLSLLHDFVIKVYLLIVSENGDRDISEDIAKLNIDSLQNIEITVLKVPYTLITERVDITSLKLPAASCLRIFIPDLVDEKVVVYLDVDIWLERSISSLLHRQVRTPLAAHFVHGSIDSFRLYGHHDNEYFLNGTLVMNLEALRDIDYTSQVVRILNSKEFANQEMDAMNLLYFNSINNSVTPLNSNFCWLNDYPSTSPNRKSRDGAEYVSPAIIHFVGPIKPWTARAYSSYHKKWRDEFRNIGNNLEIAPIDLIPLNILESSSLPHRVIKNLLLRRSVAQVLNQLNMRLLSKFPFHNHKVFNLSTIECPKAK